MLSIIIIINVTSMDTKKLHILMNEFFLGNAEDILFYQLRGFAKILHNDILFYTPFMSLCFEQLSISGVLTSSEHEKFQ